ncbi:hypothetical protein [Streptosporangium fragile]
MIRSVPTVLGALPLAVTPVAARAATVAAGEAAGDDPALAATPASALTDGAGWQ